MNETTPQAKVTPKDFFLWAGAMAALYVSVFSFMTLLFTYIDYAFPNLVGVSYGDPYSGTIRFAMASLIVLFPTYVLLMQIIRRGTLADSARATIWVRRWALYLTLFIAGMSLAIDLITLINTFLSGDVASGFLLKVALVFLVAAAFFMHFLADLWGYWQKNPHYLKAVALGASFLILATIVSGFFIVGSPASARMYAADELKTQDLTSIQWQIVNFWQAKQKLPTTLSDVADPISGFVVPVDRQTGAGYSYTVVSPQSFKLCANFNKESRNLPSMGPSAPRGAGVVDENWQHAAGEQCFTRTIDPQRYPPNAKAL